MASVLAGAEKQELVRGIAGRIVLWPRVAGRLLAASAPAVLKLLDPSGESLGLDPLPVATVEQDGSIAFTWTPGASLELAEDYHALVAYEADGRIYRDLVYCDVVLVPLACPIDQKVLEARDPRVTRFAAQLPPDTIPAAIGAAWGDVVGRVRSAGYRPALLTDRARFFEPAVRLSLANVMMVATKEPGDTWDKARELYSKAFDEAWASLGPLKFASAEDTAPVMKRSLQPLFRI